MRYYTGKNVYEEAVQRVKWIFDEFDRVIVNMSGGKDSTVVFNLCLEEAKRRNRLPLTVMWIDQEAEWQHTVDYMKSIFYREDVEPYWLQVPIILFNATSHESDNWLHCWREGEKWIREKDPISIKENTYGEQRFSKLFEGFANKTFKGEKFCQVGGVRAQESSARTLTLTNHAIYKYITWGNIKGGTPTFYPIYDWNYTDVWHAIQINKWEYNTIYDEFYRLGIPAYKMRVSNLNHETAVKSLYYVQEIEPKLWNKLVERMNGVDTTSKIDYKDNFMAGQTLPFMFKDWEEYTDYLLDKLVVDGEQHKRFKDEFTKCREKLFGSEKLITKLHKTEIASILANDWTFTKLHNFMSSPAIATFIDLKRGKKLEAQPRDPDVIKAVEEYRRMINEREDN